MSPRRIRWIARACLYGALALVALIVWKTRPGDARALTGVTAQGEHFELTVDGETPRALGTFFRADCPGSDYVKGMSWTPEDGNPVPFDREGDSFTVREEWEAALDDYVTEFGSATLDGHVEDGGKAASGHMGVTLSYYREGERYATCRVAGVRWNARVE